MLRQTMVEINVCTCDLCAHEWRSEEIPARCAKCKTTAWNNNDARELAPAPIEPIAQPQPTREPIERQTPAKAQPKRKPQIARTAAKLSMCPHKFYVLEDGTTACPRCKIG